MCLADEYSNKGFVRGLSLKHLTKSCSVEGCTPTSGARGARGLRFKHGAKGECVKPKCASNALKRGYICWKRAGCDGFCAVLACSTPAEFGKVVCAKQVLMGSA